MITKEDIARGKALCAAASKGPWRRCKAGENCQCGIVWAGDESGMVASVPCSENDVGGPIAEEPHRLANWRLIAEARTLLPAALDHAEDMDRRIEALLEAARRHESGEIRVDADSKLPPAVSRALDNTAASVLRLAVKILRGGQ
jgi:hypothetical protein